MTHFVVIFKKTTIKEDDARRKHVVQEEERKADASKSTNARITLSSATLQMN